MRYSFALIKKYWRVGSVIILMIILPRFNASKIDSIIPEHPPVDKVKAESMLPKKEVITIPAESYSANSSKILAAAAGDYWGVSMDITITQDSSSYSEEESPLLAISAASDFNDFKNIKTISLLELGSNGANVPSHYDINFKAEADYNHLNFKKNNLTYRGNVIIQNFEARRLNPESESSLRHFMPNAYGSQNNQLFLDQDVDTSRANWFLHSGTAIGQLFTAEQDLLSRVDLSLDFFGKGGNGNYCLFIADVSENNGKFKLGEERGKFCFNEADSMQYIVSFDQISQSSTNYYGGVNSDSQQTVAEGKSNYYAFPFASRLVKGNKYFIGIDNSQVETNLFNTLRVQGQKNISNGQSYYIPSSGSFKQIPDIFIKLFTASPKQYKGIDLPTGAEISQISDKTALYSYKTTESFNDVLNIYSSGNNDVWYDRDNFVTISPASKDSEIVYKFDTAYPYSQLHLETIQAAGYYNRSIVSYSLDGVNWKRILDQKAASITGQGDDNLYNLDLAGDSSSHQIFIKYQWDEQGTTDKQYKQPYFGVRFIKLLANLNL